MPADSVLFLGVCLFGVMLVALCFSILGTLQERAERRAEADLRVYLEALRRTTRGKHGKTR
jgi:hypothetical protein